MKNINTEQSSTITQIPKKPRSKFRKYAIIFLILFIFFLNPLRLNLVLDADTNLLITGATVEYQRENWSTGCGVPVESKTLLGFAIFPHANILNYWLPCAIKVSAPGYHYNGYNNLPTTFLPIRVNRIYKQISEDKALEVHRVFKENEGMDLLAYIKYYNEDIKENTNNSNNDFTFTNLSSEQKFRTDSNGQEFFTYGIAHIKFNGEGGVQAISDASPLSTGGQYYFDMENMRVAPDDGYQKELDILPGKTYIARLRDGEHYLKFHIFASKDLDYSYNHGDDIRPGIETLCMIMFVSPKVGRSVDFLNISETDFCNYDRDSNEFVYSKFIKDFSAPLITEKYASTWGTLFIRSRVSDRLYRIDFISKENATAQDHEVIIPPNSYIKVKPPSFEEYTSSQGGFVVPLEIGDYRYTGRMDDLVSVDEKNDGNVIFTQTKEEICKRDSGDLKSDHSISYYEKCISRSFGF